MIELQQNHTAINKRLISTAKLIKILDAKDILGIHFTKYVMIQYYDKISKKKNNSK